MKITLIKPHGLACKFPYLAHFDLSLRRHNVICRSEMRRPAGIPRKQIEKQHTTAGENRSSAKLQRD